MDQQSILRSKASCSARGQFNHVVPTATLIRTKQLLKKRVSNPRIGTSVSNLNTYYLHVFKNVLKCRNTIFASFNTVEYHNLLLVADGGHHGEALEGFVAKASLIRR